MNSRNRPRRAVLKGCIVSASGLQNDHEAEELACNVRNMGGIFTAELDANVTHLICSTAGSPKHREVCARNLRLSRQQRIVIVKMSWIQSCMSASLRVGHTAHVLRPLTGFEICCSGLEADEKKRIEKIAEDTGAGYSKSLGRSCTHLICSQPTGKKYDFAKGVGSIHIIRPTWVYECGRHNLLVDETLHALHGANDTGGENGEDTQGAPSVANTVTASRVTPTPTQNVDCDKMPPGTFLDSLVVYFTTCPIRDNDLHAPLRDRALRLAALGGATVSPMLSPLVNYVVIVRTPVTPSSIPDIRRAEEGGVIVAGLDWLEQCLLQRSHLNASEFETPAWAVEAEAQSHDAPPPPPVTSVLFQGVRCAVGPLALHDADSCAIVSQHIISGRGKLLPHDAAGFVSSGVPTHVVCAPSVHKGEVAVISAARRANPRVMLVTPFWVTSSVKAGRMLRVGDCSLFGPVEYACPVREMKERKISVTISGFQARPPDPNWNRRREVLGALIKLLGGGYSERMRRRGTTHVVADETGERESDKVVKAREWGIPVVKVEWLLACAERGEVVDVGPYRIAARAVEADIAGGPSLIPATLTPRRRKLAAANARRKSPRLAKTPGRGAEPEGDGEADGEEADPATTIKLFQRFAAQLNEQTGLGGAGPSQYVMRTAPEQDPDSLEDVRRSGRRASRSVSRDGLGTGGGVERREWSMDASQSQIIVHRDLTPPSTPTGKGGAGAANAGERRVSQRIAKGASRDA